MLTSGVDLGKPWHSPVCVVALIDQVDTQWPHRHTGADGTLGDDAHHAQGPPVYDATTGKAHGGTDHLADDHNEIVAVDFTDDPFDGTSASQLAHAVASSILDGVEDRVDYIKLENVVGGHGQIFHDPDNTGDWHWDDTGPSDAGPHVHFSMLHLPAVTASSRPFRIVQTTPTSPVPPSTRRPHVLTFFTIPDHPNVAARGTVWLSDGFTYRGMHDKAELATWQFIALADGYTAAQVAVGHLPYAQVQHLQAA